MFESSLIPRKSRRRTRVLVASLGLHVLAAAAAVGGALWTVDEVTDPKTHDVYFEVRLPPPPADDSGDKQPPATSGEPDTNAALPEVIQPDDVRDDSQEIVEAEDTTTNEVLLPVAGVPAVGSGGPGVMGSVGVGDGEPGPGHGPGVLGALPTPPDDDTPLRLDGRIKPPRLLPESRVEPRYPEAARRVRLAGTVVLEAVIDEHGRIRDITVRKGLPLGLDQAAIDAVSRWRFEPARLGDRAVAVYFSLTIRFELH